MLAGKGTTEGRLPAGGIQAIGDGGIVVGGSKVPDERNCFLWCLE
jgi:hypothetical protein